MARQLIGNIRDEQFNIKPGTNKFLSSILGKTRQFGQEKIQPVLDKPLGPTGSKITQGLENVASTVQKSPAFRETAGAFAGGHTEGANIGYGGSPFQEPETKVGKGIEKAGQVTGFLSPHTATDKAIGMTGKLLSKAPGVAKVGKKVKDVAKVGGEKFMNVFLRSEFGKDVIKYVPDIFKAKNLDEAGVMINKAKTELGEKLNIDAGVVMPPKKKIIAQLNKLKARYKGVNKAAEEAVEKQIKNVRSWRAQKFQKLQTKKQVLAELGSSAYKKGKSATAKARREAADVIRPYLEKIAAEMGEDIREVNRGYNALREAATAVKAQAKAQAKRAPMGDLGLGVSISGAAVGQPLIAGAPWLVKALKTPAVQKNVSSFLTKLGTKKTLNTTEKTLIKTLTKLGVLGGSQ